MQRNRMRTASENVSEQHITAKDGGVTRNNRGDKHLNQEKPTTSSDKELKVDDIDKDLSTKESPENEKMILEKGLKHSLKLSGNNKKYCDNRGIQRIEGSNK